MSDVQNYSVTELEALLVKARADRAKAKRDIGKEVRKRLEKSLAKILAKDYPDHKDLTLADIFTASDKVPKRYKLTTKYKDKDHWSGRGDWPPEMEAAVAEKKADNPRKSDAWCRSKVKDEWPEYVAPNGNGQAVEAANDDDDDDDDDRPRIEVVA